jgi:hypothetical protein
MNAIRQVPRGWSLVAALLAVAPGAAAQERLFARRAANVSPSWESVSFAGDGLLADDGSGGIGQVRIRSASQFAIPFSISVAGGRRWTVDAGGAFTSGQVRMVAGSATRDISLSGISDLRVRATGRILGDGLLLSLGATLPTGATTLSGDDVAAVRVLAAPALGFQMPGVGFGPAGSVGLVATHVFGDWVGALGASFEYRGRYSPIAALQAGAEPDFDPGNVVHASAGVERFVGEHRLTLQLGGDVFAADRLVVGGSSDAQTVKLGPVFSLETGIDLASERVRDARIYAAVRYRSAFERDGVAVDGSSGTYLDAGYRGGIAVSANGQLLLALEGLVHTGLDVDQTVTTAAAQAASLTLGWRQQGAVLVFEPFARVTAGSIDTGVDSRTMTGVAAGLMFTVRF